MFETGVAEALAAELLASADARRGRAERAQAGRVNRLLATEAGRSLILALTDEVLRIRDPGRAAAVLHELAGDGSGLMALGRPTAWEGSLRAASCKHSTLPAISCR